MSKYYTKLVETWRAFWWRTRLQIGWCGRLYWWLSDIPTFFLTLPTELRIMRGRIRRMWRYGWVKRVGPWR